MQHWLDKLTDITALQGDENILKQALGNLTNEAGFGGYAYLHIQPGHTLAVSNYHPKWRSLYLEKKLAAVDPVVKRAKTLKQALSGAVTKIAPALQRPNEPFMRMLSTSASAPALQSR